MTTRRSASAMAFAIGFHWARSDFFAAAMRHLVQERDASLGDSPAGRAGAHLPIACRPGRARRCEGTQTFLLMRPSGSPRRRSACPRPPRPRSDCELPSPKSTARRGARQRSRMTQTESSRDGGRITAPAWGTARAPGSSADPTASPGCSARPGCPAARSASSKASPVAARSARSGRPGMLGMPGGRPGGAFGNARGHAGNTGHRRRAWRLGSRRAPVTRLRRRLRRRRLTLRRRRRLTRLDDRRQVLRVRLSRTRARAPAALARSSRRDRRRRCSTSAPSRPARRPRRRPPRRRPRCRAPRPPTCPSSSCAIGRGDVAFCGAGAATGDEASAVPPPW